MKATGGQTIPIIGPVGVRLEGTIGADINLRFGFDTAGLAKYANSSNTADILEGGFFLDSRTTPLSVNAGVSAGPAIDVGLARATVQGGLLGTIDFNWRDDNNPNDPNKVRLSELSANLGTPRMFVIAGQLDASMKFSASVIGLDPYVIPFGAVTLYPAGGTPKSFPEKSKSTLPPQVTGFFNLPQEAQKAASALGVKGANILFGAKNGGKLINTLRKLDPTSTKLIRKSGILSLAMGNPSAGINLIVKHGPAAVRTLAKSGAGRKIEGVAKNALSASKETAKKGQQQLKAGIKATDKALSAAKKTASKPAQVVQKAAPVVRQFFSAPPRKWRF